MSKRSIGLVLVLTTLLVLAFSSLAMAAQLRGAGKYSALTKYLPTPKQFVTTDSVYASTYAYPNGIYLPNPDAPADYRIHSNYAKNTDACAACHATHTAVGASLLQWGNVYEACMACHDGTVTTTYNVKGGLIGAGPERTFGGMFGAGNEASLSNHNATGAVDISAAPGGTATANANEVDPTKSNATAAWSVEFGCQSCHTPHGAGGNARILHPNPNGQSWEKFNAGTTKNVTLVAAANVKAGYNAYKVSDTTFVLKGYPYSSVTAVYDDGAAITSAIIDNTNTVYSIVYIPDSLSGTFTINYVPALKVKMDVTNYLQAAESVTHQSGMNAYCGACHTDYNTEDDMTGFVDGAYNGSGSKQTGEYSEAYRHQVGMNVASFATALTGLKMPFENNKMTCETCHFAHGATKELWNDVQGADYNADEVSGSSALKRLPNMSTCEACHQKGEGNEGYGDAYAGAGATFDANNASNLQTGATFIGSSKCSACHKTHNDGWAATSHSKMVKTPTGNTKFTSAEWDALNPTINSVGGAAYFADADYVIGSKRKQRLVFLTGSATDPEYKFGSYEWYADKNGYDANGNGLPGFNAYSSTKSWEDFCMGCHTTGIKVNTAVDAIADGTWESVKEMGVGCEACHGAGSNHAANPAPTNITNPAKLDYNKSSAICGSCHNRGWNLAYTGDTAGQVAADDFLGGMAVVAGTKQREDVPQFVPGMTDAELRTFIKMYKAGASDTAQFKSTANKSYALKHHQQYMEFVDTAKHYSGSPKLSCASCHSTHSNNTTGQLKVSKVQTCGQCHGLGSRTVDNYMPKMAKQTNQANLRAHTWK